MNISEKLTKVAQNEAKVYEAGKKAELDLFWNDFQDYGNRVLYNNAFQNAWTDDIFQPKYNIRPTSAGYMFAGTKIADLKGCLDINGVTLDLSSATSVDRLFSDAPNLTYCPEISTISAPHMQNLFYNCKKLVSVDMVILKDDGSQTFNDNSFNNCTSLVEIRFSGKIGNNINFRWSKNLSVNSWMSILGALSTTATGKTITVPSNVRTIFANEYNGDDTAWDKFIGPLFNWTFAYI